MGRFRKVKSLHVVFVSKWSNSNSIKSRGVRTKKSFCHHLLSTSFSVPVDPRILNRAWAYSSSRCFKLFVVDELFVTPDPLDSPLPSMPASFGPPCDDKLLGVLKQKRGHSNNFHERNQFSLIPLMLSILIFRTLDEIKFELDKR